MADPAYITFSADIQPPMCQPFIGLINELIQQGHDEVHVLMTSPGGSVMIGVALFNMLRALPVTLVTHNVGNIDSVGNVVFLAGDRRYSAPHGTFMFHGVHWGVQAPQMSGATAREVVANIQADEDRIADIIASRTHLTSEAVKEFFNVAATKDAAFAAEVGIVDEIAEPAIPAGSVIRPFSV
jgi:ATP-dependent protease ClpP protease subunit